MQLETSVTFAADHPVFAGHFPNHPIVPGALLLDEILHAASQASRVGHGKLAQGETQWPSVWCQIASVKFLSPVQPGESVLISCIRDANRPIRFDVTCQGRAVATGAFVLEDAP